MVGGPPRRITTPCGRGDRSQASSSITLWHQAGGSAPSVVVIGGSSQGATLPLTGVSDHPVHLQPPDPSAPRTRGRKLRVMGSRASEGKSCSSADGGTIGRRGAAALHLPFWCQPGGAAGALPASLGKAGWG